MRRGVSLTALLLLAACSSSPDGASDGIPDKYTQTWAASYSDTTCDDWATAMDPHQKFAAAADMLVGARSRDGGKSLPSDSLITSFQVDVDEACQPVATMSIAEIGAGIYLIGRVQYEP